MKHVQEARTAFDEKHAQGDSTGKSTETATMAVELAKLKKEKRQDALTKARVSAKAALAKKRSFRQIDL